MVDFQGTKLDLAGINKYLETADVELSETEKQTLNSIFTDSDTFNDETRSEGKDGKLNNEEWNAFVAQIKSQLPKVLRSILNFKTEQVLQTHLKAETEKIAPADATRVEKPKIFNIKKANENTNTNPDMRANIAREAKSRGKELTDAEIEKWNNIIVTEAKQYNIPPEILIVIIGRECHFIDPKNNKNGCMQVIPSSVNMIKQDKWGIYEKVNPKCKNDSIKNLKTHNLTDRRTSIKLGTLIFQTNYAQAVAIVKGWRIGKQPDIAKAANALKNGSVQLTPSEAKKAMRIALKNYNGSSNKESYAADCIKRLDEMNYDYTRPVL